MLQPSPAVIGLAESSLSACSRAFRSVMSSGGSIWLTAACAVALLNPVPSTAGTTVRYTGTITALPNGQTSWRGYTTNNPAGAGLDNTLTIEFAINPSFSTSCVGTISNPGDPDYYSAAYSVPDSCGGQLFTSISLTGPQVFGAYSLTAGSTEIDAQYASQGATSRNIYLVGSGLTSGIRVGSNLDSSPLTDFQISGDYTFVYTGNPNPGFTPYFAPPFINGTAPYSGLPSPSDLIQFYYNSSYYRNYAITPGSSTASVTFGEGVLDFSLTQMDIIIDGVPAPLPLFGAVAAFSTARQLRRRLKHSKSF